MKIFEHSNATLTTYILEDGEFARKGLKRPAVVICPGGGYTFVSKNEGEPVALAFARLGYHAFVLDYSVKIENPFPTALRELAKAVGLVRKNAEEWLVDAENITVMGFSAGGNLAMSLGIYYRDAIITDDIGLTREDVKPDHLVLGYPAITLKSRYPGREPSPIIIEMMEKGLMPDFRGPNITEILLGKLNPSQEELDCLNLLNYIHKEVPRTFIWGTYEDSLIPPSDLLLLAEKLCENDVRCELHLFEKGPHGMSLCDKTVKDSNEMDGLSLSKWVALSAAWLEQGMAGRSQK